MNLFTSENNNEKEVIKLLLKNADINYFPNFYSKKEASNLFEILNSETAWQQDDITVYGKTYAQPRLTSFHSLNQLLYSYSGITMKSNSFSPTLLKIKENLFKEVTIKFNAVLLNLYRNGNDSIGWHSDDEVDLGKNPTIASITLGQERMFHLKHVEDKNLKYNLLLEHGSLLLMKGTTQHFWQHQISKSKKINKPRINLTFRVIK